MMTPQLWTPEIGQLPDGARAREYLRRERQRQRERWRGVRDPRVEDVLWRCAITQTPLTSDTAFFSGTSYDTASVSPGANKLVIVGAKCSAASAPSPSGISGAGLTFVKFVEGLSAPAQTNVSLWRAMSASPGSGVLTITHSGADLVQWSVFELDGVETSGSNGENAVNANVDDEVDVSGSNTSITATLPNAFGHVNNGVISACGWLNFGAAATCTPGSGFTEIHEFNFDAGGVGHALQTQFRPDNDLTADVTWSLAGGMIIVAAEIIASGAVPPIHDARLIQKPMRPRVFAPGHGR